MPVLGLSNNVLGGIYQATASGSIAKGKACIINSNGTVSQAASVAGARAYVTNGYEVRGFKLAIPFDTSATTDGTYQAQETAGKSQRNYSVFNSNKNYPEEARFNSDGTKIFMADSDSSDSIVREFSMSTAYDVSTVTYVDGYTVGSKASSLSGLDFKPDGTRMFIINDNGSDSNVHEYTLSTAFDVSTASFTRTQAVGTVENSSGLTFKPDGTKFYITVGRTGSHDKTYQFSMSTAWDLTTESYDSVSLDHSSYTSNSQGATFNDDGTKFYTMDSGGNTVIEYTLSTAYALNTASFTSETAVNPATGPQSIMFGFGGNATTKNYIGISQGAASDGATVDVKTIGGIDTNQSGLTPNELAYIADSGAITSTNTGEIAGQALSPTTLLIKNQYDMLFD